MIRIEVTGYNDKPLAHSIAADFDTGGGTIGRSPENTLVLLDPERKISRTHASLAYAGGSYVLRDQGSIVPVVLNGQPIGNGRESPIAPGDEIRIAGYVMRVLSATAEDAITQAHDRLAVPLDIDVGAPAEPPAPIEPDVAAPPQPPTENKTDVAATPQPPPENEPDVAAPPQPPTWNEPDVAAPPQPPPENEPDVAAPPQQPTENEPQVVAAPQPATESEADVIDAAGTEMAEPVLSWTSTEESGNIDATTTIILSPAGRSFMEHDDGQRDAPEQGAIEDAPGAEQTPPIAATRDAGAPLSTNDALLRALLTGAGIREIDVPGGLTPQLMNQLGQIMREAVSGLLDLLAARAMTKREVRADMTVIVAKDNNPLKFSPDMEAALTHLLVPRGRGFMPPLRAVSDAYDDLRAHQLGFMAGMRSALAVVLTRFDPRKLEEKMQGTSVVDSILPTHRKAKLWDLFAELYGTISKDAQNDFHVLFGREFLRAYQAHVAKLPDRGESAAKHGSATHDPAAKH